MPATTNPVSDKVQSIALLTRDLTDEQTTVLISEILKMHSLVIRPQIIVQVDKINQTTPQENAKETN